MPSDTPMMPSWAITAGVLFVVALNLMLPDHSWRSAEFTACVLFIPALLGALHLKSKLAARAPAAAMGYMEPGLAADHSPLHTMIDCAMVFMVFAALMLGAHLTHAYF